MPGDNYAPPRSGTAGRVGTALHADTDTVYRFTNTQRGKLNGETFIEVANYIYVLIGSFEAVVP